MVDHPDEFGPKESQPAPPEGDPNADFFHEMTDDEPAPSAPPASSVPPTPPMPPSPTDVSTSHGATASPQPSRPAPPSTPPPTIVGESKHPIFPIIVGLFMTGALVGAVIYSRKTETEAAQTSPSPAAPASAPSSSIDTLTAEVKSLQGKIDGLTAQTKDLQDRFEKLPKPEPATDFKSLQARIDKLAKATESVAPLPARVSDLDERAAALDKSLASLRKDIDTLQGEVKKTAATPKLETTKDEAPKAETTTPRSENMNVAGEGLEQGVELVKQRKFKEASDLFHKLTDEFPKDAARLVLCRPDQWAGHQPVARRDRAARQSGYRAREVRLPEGLRDRRRLDQPGPGVQEMARFLPPARPLIGGTERRWSGRNRVPERDPGERGSDGQRSLGPSGIDHRGALPPDRNGAMAHGSQGRTSSPGRTATRHLSIRQSQRRCCPPAGRGPRRRTEPPDHDGDGQFSGRTQHVRASGPRRRAKPRSAVSRAGDHCTPSPGRPSWRAFSPHPPLPHR